MAEGKLMRLDPRPVELLREALRLRTKGVREGGPTPVTSVRPEIGSTASLPHQSQHATVIRAEDFTWEEFPNPSDWGEEKSQPPCRSEDVKPRGPDAGELEPIVAAINKRNTERRASWRKKNLDLCDAGEKQQKLLNGEGRVKAANADTQRSYLERGLGLIARYKRELDVRASTEDIDPRLFASWMQALKPFLNQGTWRNYRQAAATVLRAIPSVYAEEAIGMLNEDLQVGADEGGRARRSQTGEDAEAFARRMDHGHFLCLRQAVRDMEPISVSLALRDWLDAGISTGLRPGEWELAFIEKQSGEDRLQIWLHVVAARGVDGPHIYRSLNISSFSNETLEAVERMVGRSRAWTLSGQSAMGQSEVSKLLRGTCNELFPGMSLRYTLYSLRYQFIANMNSIYGREQVAAMADYVPTGAKPEHYRKRRPYWSEEEIPEVPTPVGEQVTRIRSRLRFLDERLAIKSIMEAARRSDK